MADKKITDLSEETLPVGADLLELATDVSTTPVSMKVKVQTLLKRLFLASGTMLSITTIADGEFLKRSGTNITSGLAVLLGAITGSGLTMATNKVLGRQTAGTGAIEELAVTGTGNVVQATSPTLVTPVLGTPTSGTLSNCTVDGTSKVGFRQVPQRSSSANTTTVAADDGKHLYHPTSDNNARTFTIDSNANVPYEIGTCITFVNDKNVLTIAITSDTLVWAQDGSTGSRTLAENGMATAIKVTTTRWIISGTGLT